jgi:3-dehydrotetronate 4-kinase
MSLRLGCIADDLTGATDVALMLRNAGMRTIQSIGAPAGFAPVADAVAQSLAALEWLRKQGGADPVQVLLDLRFDP